MKTLEINLEALDMRYEKLRARQALEEKRLLASLGDGGQQSPIIVVRAGGIGRYVVIDGHKRTRALRKLRADTVKAALWEAPAPEALIHAYQMQTGSGYSPLEEGWLLEELHRRLSWPLADCARALGKSKSWVSRRLGLVDGLPEIVLEGVQKGKIGAYSAMKYLLPLARANAKDCEALAKAISEHSLSSRQVEILYNHRAQAPKAIFHKIMENPMLFLKAQEQATLGTQDHGLTALENRVLNNLKILGSISLGLARSLPEAAGYDAGSLAKARLHQGWTAAWDRLNLLEKTGAALFAKGLVQELSHAG